MGLQRWLMIAVVFVFVFGIEGCGHFNEIRETTDERAGSFQTLDELFAAAKHLQVGITTCPAGLKAAGFDPAMKNVTTLPGAQGKDYIMGPNSQLLASNSEAIDEAGATLDKYDTYLAVFRHFTKIQPFLWFFKKDPVIKGPEKQNASDGGQDASHDQKASDGKYIIKCRLNEETKEKVVIFHAWNGTQDMYRKEPTEKPGGNILEPLIMGGAAGGALLGIMK